MLSKENPTKKTTWLLLALAVCLEISGVFGLRYSEGFTLVIPTSIALFSFALALCLVSHVMKTLPVSIAYPIWAGGGTAGTAILGIWLMGEEINYLKALGILLIILGVVFVNATSNKTSGC